jgi:hypothetical protein
MTLSSHPQTRRAVIAASLVTAAAVAPVANAEGYAPADLPTGDIHDFDFLYGDWIFTNRQLKQRWVGSDDWEVFPASLHCEGHMGGVVNIDEGVFPTKGFSGMTVRIFNPATRQWSLYWINSKTGVLFPPVVGGFTGDRGEFYGEDTDAGRAIKARFIWTRQGADKARWEQAFSLDGKTWETNWVMEHSRVRA